MNSPAQDSPHSSSPFSCIIKPVKKMYRSMFCNHPRGKRQSPVDIKTGSAICDKHKCEACSISIVCQPGDCDVLNICPSTWKVSAVQDCQTTMKASHLPATFRLAQFHAHWGPTSDTGSEHTVDGKHYAGEIHFVFWNTSYGTPEVAAAQPDGNAVLGVFITEGHHNKTMDVITELVQQCLKGKGNGASMPKEFEITDIIPLGSDYFFYEGGLTTPPFSETVLWTILMKPLEVSPEQLNVFRQICPANYRECQAMHGRKILTSAELGA